MKLFIGAVNANKCLMTRMQEMSLNYHFMAEQESGSTRHAFFGFNGTSISTILITFVLLSEHFIFYFPSSSNFIFSIVSLCYANHSYHLLVPFLLFVERKLIFQNIKNHASNKIIYTNVNLPSNNIKIFILIDFIIPEIS